MIQKNNFFESFILNFGPQHPAAHGVLRLIIELKGEFLINLDSHIGLLHRGTEKLLENKSFFKGLPYFDRLDYVSPLAQEHSYVIAVETLMNLSVPIRSQYARVLFLELTRILNHLMAVTTHALDIGAITPFLWGFDERETMLQFCEELSGARMHTLYFRVGGVTNEIPGDLIDKLFDFSEEFDGKVSELEELLSKNIIWISRLKNIGKFSKIQALSYSWSGPVLRSIGIPWDLRKTQPYEMYNNMLFLVPLGIIGDCYDRYLVRINEMKQSAAIIHQVLHKMPYSKGFFINKQHPYSRKLAKIMMEELIKHFLYYSIGFNIMKSYVYIGTESPKGEFGVFFFSNNSSKPERCKIRSPGFYHLQSLSKCVLNQSLADLITVIGTLDIVFGEIDR